MASSQRLAAILFTDIVGYTALMGSNEEEAMLQLQKNRSIHITLIKKYGGSYVKEIGDGTLAHFSSIHEAVRCAIAIQESAKEKMNAQLRMGIHLGEVIFENDDVFGDGVNIASRIEPLADPGGICITGAVEKALLSYPDIHTVYLGKTKLKNVAYPMDIYAISGHSLSVPSQKTFVEKTKRRKSLSLKPFTILLYIAIPAALLLLIFFSYTRKLKIQRAQAALVNLGRIVDSSWRDYSVAYHLAKSVQKIIPGNQELDSFIKRSSLRINITSEPEGAGVYIKEYDHPEKDWQYLGTTPLTNFELPITVFRWKLGKQGYDTVYAAQASWGVRLKMGSPFVPYDFNRKLDPVGDIPPGMVRVPGAVTGFGKLGDFFIDKYEVTNKQFKDFIDHGGYTNKNFWKNEFIKDGKVLTWEEAMKFFVDQTGRPGPSTWQASTYPEGQDKYPVCGVSWYEAAAYAAYAGKALPTGSHWGLAMGELTPLIRVPQFGGYANFAPFYNFRGTGPLPVGQLNGLSTYGAYDMGGNVREWCWNETPNGRLLRGGAWNDVTYLFTDPSQDPPFDRSSKNGFRCAIYQTPERIPDKVFGLTVFDTNDSGFYSNQQPVSEDVYRIFRQQFLYDKTKISATVEKVGNSEYWTHERVTFDAAYGKEKVIAHLFLPANAKPPFQTVIYFPGGGVRDFKSSADIENYDEFRNFVTFIIKNGRCVLFPVYKGTFERSEDGLGPELAQHGKLHQFTEYRVQLVKDLRKCIDYLETRKDIDTTRIAYYGLSWGVLQAPIMLAVENRLKVGVLLSGGFVNRGLPEVNPINYLTRVKQPILMLNGKYDMFLPYDKAIIPMYNLLGTPKENKQLKLYDTDHIPGKRDFMKETLSWLDKYLGPVR